jgi:hypothetical protein
MVPRRLATDLQGLGIAADAIDPVDCGAGVKGDLDKLSLADTGRFWGMPPANWSGRMPERMPSTFISPMR